MASRNPGRLSWSGWRVRYLDPHWVSVRVWCDGERVPFADVKMRFDDRCLLSMEMAAVSRDMPERFDELFVSEPVRPMHVARLIREMCRPGADDTRV